MTEKEKSTRVAVIGAGPGGYAAAFMAADLGLDVTMIDLDPYPGGTCLYRGCIPSKALLHAAKILTEAREAEHWGIQFAEPKVDVDKLRAATAQVVDQMTKGVGMLSTARKIRSVQGRAEFLDSTSIRVHFGDGKAEEIAFDYAILATGSRPAALEHLMIESDRLMNSTDALELPDVPKTLLAIGGGYIGLELATVYAALGSKVTVVDIAPTILLGADKDLVRPLKKRMDGVCEAIYLDTTIHKLEETKKGIRVTWEGPEITTKTKTFDKVLMSVGRKPNSSGLGLNTTKVQIDGRGFISVDEQMRTDDPRILAIGDLVGQPMLAHKATHEGIVAAEVIAGRRVAFEPRCIPAVVYTDPQVAWVGLTETEAKDQKRKVKVARFPWSASGRATTLNRNDGVTKIIADPETDELLGVGICGDGAGELIAEAALAIEMGATARDLSLTIHPHPTLTETIMESAELVGGRTTHIYKAQKKKG